MAITQSAMYPPDACSLVYGNLGSACKPSADPSTRIIFQNQKKNQQEKDKSNGIKKPNPMANGYAEMGIPPMAFHGGSVNSRKL